MCSWSSSPSWVRRARATWTLMLAARPRCSTSSPVFSRRSFRRLSPGGIVKGVLAVIAGFGIDTGSGDWAIFNMMSDIPFYFLPFLLSVSAAKKFKVNPFLALCVAGSLMYPTLVSAVGTGESPFTLFGIALPVFSYASSVFPVIFGVAGLSVVYGSSTSSSPTCSSWSWCPRCRS